MAASGVTEGLRGKGRGLKIKDTINGININMNSSTDSPILLL